MLRGHGRRASRQHSQTLHFYKRGYNMPRQQNGQQLLNEDLDPRCAIIAQVPVLVTLTDGDETIHEFDTVIDLTFTDATPAGRKLTKRMSVLMLKEGLSL